jgi:hypothetical protein
MAVQSKQEGVVGLILLGVIVVAIAVAAFFFVARAQKGTTSTDAKASRQVRV